jgi:hypothetical protein
MPVLEQAAQEAAKQGGQGPATVIGLGLLIVSNVGIWLDKLVQMSKNRTARKEAEAREAEAKVLAGKSSPVANSTNGHAQYVLPHSIMLERHDGEIKALRESSAKFERENREDHGKMFTQIGDVKDLIIERLPRTGG